MRSPMPNSITKKVVSSTDAVVISMPIPNHAPKKGRRKPAEGDGKVKPWYEKTKEVRQKDKKPVNDQPVVTPVILMRNPNLTSVEKSDGGTKKMEVAKPVQVTSKAASDVASSVIHIDMSFSAKVMDENLSWCDELTPFLLEQSDFFVVAVMGLQGTGKSTICSYLADPANAKKISSTEIFKIQSDDQVLQGTCCTHGIEAYITKDRVIILDVQPILSSSIMEYLVAKERKVSTDFNSIENMLEIESFQLLTMVMSTCHVMLLVQDYIMDPSLLRMLHTCQIFKPACAVNNAGRDGNSRNVSFNQPYYPHLVFVQNRCQPHHYLPGNVAEMQNLYQMIMGDSCFYIDSQIGITSGTFSPTLNPSLSCPHLNLFLLPDTQNESNCPLNFKDSMVEIRRQLFSLSRSPITHVPMTEKSWYQFCGKMWDTVRKSNLFQEYCKLLP